MKVNPLSLSELEINFKHSHALITGNLPHSVGLENFNQACIENLKEESIKSFGLFDVSAPNYTTFYPEAKPEDWIPSDSDYIEPVYRALSATTVYWNGYWIDFSKPGLLKESMGKLVGATVIPDHESPVGNAMGSVAQVAWQNASTQEGVKIPAGINAVLKIDAKSNPRIARGIMMEPPSIHSTSVTVRFKWAKSHDVESFWELMGTFDEKGNMYRLIATEIRSYSEISLVSHGADPYAQKIGPDGKLNNPKYAETVYGFAATKASERATFGLDFKDTFESDFSFNNTFNNFNNNDMEFSEFLTTLNLGDKTFTTPEEFAAHFAELASAKETLDSLMAITPELSATVLQGLVDNQIPEGGVLLQEGQIVATPEESAVLAAVTELGGMDAIRQFTESGKSHLERVRLNAITNYRLLNPDNANEAIITNIQNADLVTAQAFEAQFQAEVEKQIPLVCQDCSSHNVSRAAAKAAKDTVDTSFEEEKEKFVKSTRRKASDIHK